MPREIARVRPPSVGVLLRTTANVRWGAETQRPAAAAIWSGTRTVAGALTNATRDLTNDTRANMTARTRPRNRQNTIDDSSPAAAAESPPDFFHLPPHSAARVVSPHTHTRHGAPYV